MSNQEFAMICIVIGFVAVVLWLVWRIRPKSTVPKLDPKKFITVDGSNVMYWGGEPSLMVLCRVIRALTEHGLTPLVYFDANAGYRLWGRHADAQAIAAKLKINPRHVIVVSKGVTADEILLKMAAENKLRVVTNDRFREWRMKYPMVKENGWLVKGEWREGTVVLRGL